MRTIVALLALALLPISIFTPLNGADLTLYRRMASAAAPYADPYADFPPLKMALFAVIERAAAWRWFGYALALGLAFVIVAYLRRRGWRDWPAALGAFGIVSSPVLYVVWWAPFEDKAAYPLLLLAILLALPTAPTATWPRYAAVGALCGLLQGYGEVAAVLPAIVAVWLWRSGRRDWHPYAALFGAFAAVTIAAHLPYFPDWPAGYAHRSARMAFDRPYHQSVWWPAYWIGLYRPWLPTAAMLAGFGAALGLAWGRWPVAAIVLAHVAALAFGPEAGWDRLAAAGLPVVVTGLTSLPPVSAIRAPRGLRPHRTLRSWLCRWKPSPGP